jgi:hypothetical protein
VGRKRVATLVNDMTVRDRQPLSVSLWVFIVFKAAGILLNLGFIVLVVFWAMPKLSAAKDSAAYAADLSVEPMLAVLEVVLTSVGLLLILRRSRHMRRFWLIYLVIYCLAQVWQLLFGLEGLSAILFLVTGVGWLAYWAFARRPRELLLGSFWSGPTPEAMGR